MDCNFYNNLTIELILAPAVSEVCYFAVYQYKSWVFSKGLNVCLGLLSIFGFAAINLFVFSELFGI